MPQYRPDKSIKLTIWTTAEMKRLVDRVCKKWEVFEADVLTYTLEAMIPIAARRGLTAILPKDEVEELKTPFARKRPEHFPMKLTIRTNKRTKRLLAQMARKSQRTAQPHTEAALLRFAYQGGLPLALKEGMSAVLALREANLNRQRKAV